MTTAVEDKAQALLARLDREIARVEAGTVAIGGITKVGTDLEALLRAAASAACKAQGTTLDAEVTRRKLTRGAGTYARVLADARGGLDPVGEVLARDLRAPRSRVQALVDLRNTNSHSSELPATYRQTLTAVAAMLRPVTGSP